LTGYSQTNRFVLTGCSIVDTESGTLFWYQDHPSATPVKIEKIDENHWIVVFEKAKTE
jgi:hypothetical protein